MTDCVRPVFLSLDDTRFDDTLIMTEYRLNTLRPGKLANLDVSAEFIHFVLDISI